MSSTQFRVLGPLEVERDGVPITIGAPKERALLLYLLLNDSAVAPVDRLVDALWAGEPPSSAAKLVQLYVSHLRKQARSRGDRNGSLGLSDADLSPRPRLRALRAAASGRSSSAGGRQRAARRRDTEPWARTLARPGARRRLATTSSQQPKPPGSTRLRLDCFEARLAALLALGENEDVLAEAARLSAEHPHRERLRGLHMIALYRAGRQVEALEVFRQARDSLIDELGLEPGADLRAVELAILRQDPALAPQPVQQESVTLMIPTALTSLVGRERELRDLRDLVLRTDIRLVTLVGAGGSGKTRLALALASESQPFFANGVAVVELSALREPALVLPTIAQALRVGEQPGEPLAQTLAAWAAERELLLVVDNFEQVAEAGLDLLRLIEASPRLTVVVTSRRVLHLSGEHVFPVEPLAEEDAADLFVARAGALNPRSPLDADDPDVREICRRLDGLPLAIELAASRTHTLSPNQLLERLGERLTLLTGGPHDLPARQQTLRDTLDWSAELLSSGEREMLARLSVFPNDASLEAATDVTSGDLDTLEGLVTNSMVQRVSVTDHPRFRMLETVREYALELLADDRRTRCGPSRSVFPAAGGGSRSSRPRAGSLAGRPRRGARQPPSRARPRPPLRRRRDGSYDSSSLSGASGGCAATSSRDALDSRRLSRAPPKWLRGFGPTPIAAVPESPGARVTWFVPASSPHSASRPPNTAAKERSVLPAIRCSGSSPRPKATTNGRAATSSRAATWPEPSVEKGMSSWPR